MQRGGHASATLTAVLLASIALGGCSRERTLKCGTDADYVGAESANQLRIPDDLSVPDETDSLRIPGPAPTREDAAEGQTNGSPCLQESPALGDSDDSGDVSDSSDAND